MKRSVFKKTFQFLRYDLWLWLIDLLTCWMPEISLVCYLRGFLCHPFLGQCGKRFSYGKGVRFLNPRGITVGDDVYIAAGCWLSGGAALTIGDEVLIGPYCNLATGNHTFKGRSYRFGGFDRRPVTIGEGSWLATHVVITPGVNIGKRNLVAANAVVTKSTPDDVIVGGVPAKVIATRQENEEIIA